MATGTVNFNENGHGAIAPDSRGEDVFFTSDDRDPGSDVRVGGRVHYLVRITDRGVLASQVRPLAAESE